MDRIAELRAAAGALDAVPRTFTMEDVEIRSAPSGSDSPAGLRFYAALYGALSLDLGGFREEIAPGCFDAAIREDDIRALFNHDKNLVLGRSAPAKGVSTATITSDARGLLVDVPELPNTSYARDLVESLRRSDVDQSSFGFRTVEDEWREDRGQVVRTLKEARLFDVSVVTFPAYPDTMAEARSVALAYAEIRAGKVLSDASRSKVQAALDALTALLATADGEENGLRSRLAREKREDARDGYSIAWLGQIIADCEWFAEYVADDAEDAAAMEAIVASLKAMVVVEATPDADDEGDRSLALAQARARALALAVPLSPTTLR
jgi:HK97 family phage prohead protease